jgi:MoxR-like ATPase
MAEASVTIAGERHGLEQPFVVLATQNPIEMEGTYPLPEAQLDRFLFKILVPQPDEATLVGIFDRTTGNAKAEVPRVVDGPEILRLRELVREVRVAEPILRFVARLVRGSDPSLPECAPSAKRLLRYGAGVRGGQSILLASKVCALMDGRAHVSFADVRRVALPSLRHRIIPSFEAEADGVTHDAIVGKLLDEVPEVSAAVAAIAS